MGLAFLTGGWGNLLVMLLKTGLLAQGGLEAAIAVMVMGISYGGIALSVFVGMMIGRRQTRRRLAGLPFVTVEPPRDQYLSCRCPHCAAPLMPAGNTLVVRCGHCQAESLLPAVLVDNRLQVEHQRLTNLRRRGDVLTVAPGSMVEAVNYSVGIAFLVIGFLLGGGLPVTIFLAAPPHLQGVEKIMICLLSGLFAGGIFGFGGILSICSHRNLIRRPPGT